MKHVFTLLNVLRANTPPCEGRIASRKILSLLLILFLSIGNVWAEVQSTTEDFEKQKAESTYNSVKEYGESTSNASIAWYVEHGVVSTNNKLSGNQSLQMRAYYAKNSATNVWNGALPYLESKTPIKGLANITFNGRVGNTTLKVDVMYSTDGLNWTNLATAASYTTSSKQYSYDIPNPSITNDYYIKIAVNSSSTHTANPSSTGNIALIVDDITFTYETSGSTAPTLSSIAISGDLTNKTYEEGQELDLTGLTVTGTYSDASTQDVTADVEWSYNPLTQGQTSVTVTATYEEQTADITITGMIVNEHVVTPGEYTIALNNVFFGTTAGTSIPSFPLSAKQDDITVTLNGSGNKTRTDAANVRMYTGNTLTFSVPSGYVIKSIVFAEPTSSKTWDGEISVATGTYTEDAKSWAGNAQEVVFSFGAQNRIATATVTYAADVKYTLNITTPANGTLVVKEGETELANGAQVSSGTSLTVIPTPAEGYLFESLTVGSENVTLTDGKYTFTMPESDVTVAATFKLNEKPAATLTLSINGNTDTKINGKQDDKITLPSEIDNNCSKTFVGWDANAECTSAPEYALGAEYTLTAEEQTLYAVYADVVEGEPTWNRVTNIAALTSGGTFIIGYEATAKSGKIIPMRTSGTATTSTAGYMYSGNADGTTSNNATLDMASISESSKFEIVLEASSIVDGAVNIKLGDNYLGNTDTKNNCKLFTSASKNTAFTPTIGTNDVVKLTIKTNEDYTTLQFNNNSGSYRYAVYGGAQKDVVFYKKEITSSYSNYSTTCVAALDEPVFSVEGGENEAKTITLTATEGTIYYTLDGSTPTALSEKYTTPIVLDECGTTTINAIAIGSGSVSPVASATYTINLPITNTEATAYTPAEAIAIIDGACDKTEEVYVKGVVVSTSGLNTEYGNYDNVVVKAVDDESAEPTKFTFFRLYKAAEKTKFTASDEVIGVGDIITAKGKLTKYNSTYELAEGCYLVSRVANVKLDAELAWSTETVTLTVGDAFTAPTLSNPNDVTVSFESSNTELATVDAEGVITLVEDAVGTATITATFAGDATYKPAEVTCTIKVKPIPEDCEGSDDFETDESESPLSYLERTTAAGWKATNAARVTIEDETYFAINGKTSTVGTITSPVLNGGIGSVKIRYANTYKEANGVSFQLDIKQNEEVVKTYTITKANADVEKGTVYTELIENINVAGDFQMVFTNLHPTNNNEDNKDRVSIGRLCWTGYVAPTPVAIRENLTVGQWGTLCPTQNVENPTGATFYQIAYLEEKDNLPFNMHFNQITATTLTAGQPYFFIASETEIKGVKSGEVKTEGSNVNGFYGYIGETSWTLPYQASFDVESDENTFVIWNNSVFRINAETKIKSERCYININESEPIRTSTPAPVGARRITMGVSGINGQNTATGMENVDASAQPTKMIIDGQLYILRGEKMYDTTGKLVK